MSLAKHFRLGMRRLASGISVLSSQKNGVRYAMTASSVTSLSDNPASLLMCVNTNAGILSVLDKGQAFAVNVLGNHQQNVSNLCAQKDAGEDRFNEGQWTRHPDFDLPYLEDSEVTFFCEVDNDTFKYGTHDIIVGRINEITLSDKPLDPLVYLDGAYKKVI
jgi:flavin reductase (DIM6/NTAB) family NADH-FMN oxidoreductase RutF